MDNLSKEAKITTLTNIQGTINRFSDVSSKLKGVYITIMSALLTVVIAYVVPNKSIEDNILPLIFISLIFLVIFLCFLIIDSAYLYYERIMRKVYDAKARDKKVNGKEIDNYFEISSEFEYIKTRKTVSGKPSSTQFWFYSIPFFVFVISIWIIWYK